MTNGLGGYAASTVIGAHTRLPHGYLVAAVDGPLDLMVVLSKTTERISLKGRVFDLSTAQHKGQFGSEYNIGNQFLLSFNYDGRVTFKYECGTVRLTKTIELIKDENRVQVTYQVENRGDAATLSITPLLNYRIPYNAQTVAELSSEIIYEDMQDLHFAEDSKAVGFYYSPASNGDVTVAVGTSEGRIVGSHSKYDEYQQLEQDAISNSFTPVDFVIDIPAGGYKEIAFACQLTKTKGKESRLVFEEMEEADQPQTTDAEETEPTTADLLAESAAQYLVYDRPGGQAMLLPSLLSYSQSGRDMLIAFQGILLETGHLAEARQVLSLFAANIRNGMVPSNFRDAEGKASYNLADCSLLYFKAVYDYLQADDTKEGWSFVQEQIYPGLQLILNAFRRGTSFSIGMEENGLLRAGNDLEHVTWMETRSKDWLTTPRQGHMVELNALWYNALMSMEHISRGLAKRDSTRGADYLAYAATLNEIAIWVQDSFVKEFWYEDGGYLYDFINGDYRDTSFRANQLYAVGLPFTMLNEEKNSKILNKVTERLYTGWGVRGQERGDSYSFLLGIYFDAYTKVKGLGDEAGQEALALLSDAEQQLATGLLGHMPARFTPEGDLAPDSAIASAAACGELLRTYRRYSTWKK